VVLANVRFRTEVRNKEDSTMSVEMSVDMSAEEIRLEMRQRFDAVNAAAKNRRQMRLDSQDVRQAEEDKRWSRPAVKPALDADDDAYEVGENDSLGG
jgi:hypothetical protein